MQGGRFFLPFFSGSRFCGWWAYLVSYLTSDWTVGIPRKLLICPVLLILKYDAIKWFNKGWRNDGIFENDSEWHGHSTAGRKINFPGFISQGKPKQTSSSDSLENPESVRLSTRPNWPSIKVSSPWWKTGYVSEKCEFAPLSRGQKDASLDVIIHTIFNLRAESESSENFRWIRFFKRPNRTSIKGVRAVEEIDVKLSKMKAESCIKQGQSNEHLKQRQCSVITRTSILI